MSVEITIPDGHKFDDGKLQYHLMPPKAYQAAADIMTGGAKKYNENNWTGLKASRIISATYRHLNAFLSGNDLDNDSHAHHMHHVLANLLMLHHILNNFPEQDDRYYSYTWDKSEKTEKDIHIYKPSRHDSYNQYTLLPIDSLEAAIEYLQSFSLDEKRKWYHNLSIKTLIDTMMSNFIEVISSKNGLDKNLGQAIANAMIMVEVLEDESKDDRIFTYLGSASQPHKVI